MIRWMRVVLPVAPMTLVVALVLYGLAEAATWGVERTFDKPWEEVMCEGKPPNQQGPLQQYRPSLIVLWVELFIYVFVRVGAFHPVFRPEYHQWLATIPWTGSKPLPLGPVHLVMQDAVVLGLCTLMALPGLGSACYVIPIWAAALHALLLAVTLMFTGAKEFGWASILCVGLAIRLAHLPVAAVAAVAVADTVVVWGLFRSYASFPWKASWLQRFQSGRGIEAASPMSRELGWPFCFLSPKPSGQTRWTIDWRNAFAASLLMGWLLYAIGSRYSNSVERVVVLVSLAALPLTLGPLARLAEYLPSHAPPISSAGRLATKRWLIPDYDFVFISTLGCWAAAIFVPQLLFRAGIDWEYSIPIGVSCAWFMHSGIGPSLLSWQLTGSRRMVAPYGRADRSYVQVG